MTNYQDARTTEIHYFKTNLDELNIKLCCRYRYWREYMFAYYITATPIIKRTPTSQFTTFQHYAAEVKYALASRYNKCDVRRINEQIKKAAEDFEHNVYNNSPAAYQLGLVLHSVLCTVKEHHNFPLMLEPLRVITQDDKKPRTGKRQPITKTKT